MGGVRGLRDRSRERAAQSDSLMRRLPDREHSAENEDEVDRAFKQVAFLFFRANEQRVGRFESVGGECGVFHMFDWVDDHPLCKGRATASR